MKPTPAVLMKPGATPLGSTRHLSARAVVAQVGAAIAALVIAAHGMVHLIGVWLLWKLGEPGAFHYRDMAPDPGTGAAYLAGTLWLAAATAFVAAGVLLAARRPGWWIAALSSVAISAPVLALNPSRDAAGLVVDGLVLLGVLASGLATKGAAP